MNICVGDAVERPSPIVRFLFVTEPWVEQKSCGGVWCCSQCTRWCVLVSARRCFRSFHDGVCMYVGVTYNECCIDYHVVVLVRTYVRRQAGRWYRDVVGGTGIQAGIRFLF